MRQHRHMKKALDRRTPEQKAFDRETERRRKEMLRHLGAGVIHSNNISHRRLARLVTLSPMKPVMAMTEEGKLVHLRKQYQGRNMFRVMARKVPRTAEVSA